MEPLSGLQAEYKMGFFLLLVVRFLASTTLPSAPLRAANIALKFSTSTSCVQVQCAPVPSWSQEWEQDGHHEDYSNHGMWGSLLRASDHGDNAHVGGRSRNTTSEHVHATKKKVRCCSSSISDGGRETAPSSSLRVSLTHARRCIGPRNATSPT